jgi:hypothetical protein
MISQFERRFLNNNNNQGLRIVMATVLEGAVFITSTTNTAPFTAARPNPYDKI